MSGKVKWRIQRESLRVWDYLGDPSLPVWAVYPPERNRKPYLFATWRAALDWTQP